MLLSQTYIKNAFGEVTEYTEMVPSFIIYCIFRRNYAVYSLPAILFAASAFLILLRVLSVPAVEHVKCVRVRCGISLRAPPVVH